MTDISFDFPPYPRGELDKFPAKHFEFPVPQDEKAGDFMNSAPGIFLPVQWYVFCAKPLSLGVL
jgi:hypothetical protein